MAGDTQVSHEKNNSDTFHSTGRLIGILILASYNLKNNRVGFHPLWKPPNKKSVCSGEA